MKSRSREYTLVAGLALILLANAVALLGAAWNRSGDPASVLKLSQRELHLPYWGMGRENSGMALSLVWRFPVPDSDHANGWSYAGSGGSPAWLDQAKLESLGFDIAAYGQAQDAGRRAHPLGKEVLFVLELNGAAYQQSLERARRYAAEENAKLAAMPDKAEFKLRAKQAQDRLRQEELESSRLFVIDAGMELPALRAKYPDRGRCAIVRGRVRPRLSGSGRDVKMAGYIDGISIGSINVPFEHRSVFEMKNLQDRGARAAQLPPFDATLAIGRRLEPWIVDISVAPKK